jgi:acyl-coenzyme A thioesterase PaaI-like protein
MNRAESRTDPLPNFVPINERSRFSEILGQIYVPEDQTGAAELFQFAVQLDEPHTGRPGHGHGGVSMSFLDEAMGRAATEASDYLCVTLSMTTNFCASSNIGDFIIASVRVRRRGKNVVFVDAELHAGTHLLATATGTWMNTRLPIPRR